MGKSLWHMRLACTVTHFGLAVQARSLCHNSNVNNIKKGNFGSVAL